MTVEEAVDSLMPELRRRLEKQVNFLMGLVLKNYPKLSPVALRRVLKRKVVDDLRRRLDA